MLTEMVKQAMPAQIALKIPRCDAMKSHHPLFETAVISIDVLNVVNPANHSLPCGNIHRAMDDTCMFSNHLVSCRTIGTEHHILLQQGFEYGFNLFSTYALQNKVSRIAMTIPHHQYRNLLSRQASFRSFTAPFAGNSG